MEDSMTNSNFRTMSRIAMALAVGLPMTGCAMAVEESESSQGEALSAKSAPPVPSALAVPDGNRLAFHFDAIGVQIYACQPLVSGFGWVFQAPEAKLFGRGGHIAGTHYAGPTWEANDGSKVIGAKVASFVSDPSAIPWLLLSAVSNEGHGRMAKVTFIQRLDTAGGTAPVSGCDADHVGSIARVDYTATYFFYEARGGKSES